MSLPQTTPSKCLVVMVDDNELDLEIAQMCFKKSKLTCDFLGLTSGPRFLDYLREVEQGVARLPVMVMLDINMPEMSGFEVLKEVRAQQPFQELPVIMMLTHSDSQDDVKRAQQLGANGFQTKPQRVADFVSFFNSLATQCDLEPETA